MQSSPSSQRPLGTANARHLPSRSPPAARSRSGGPVTSDMVFSIPRREAIHEEAAGAPGSDRQPPIVSGSTVTHRRSARRAPCSALASPLDNSSRRCDDRQREVGATTKVTARHRHRHVGPTAVLGVGRHPPAFACSPPRGRGVRAPIAEIEAPGPSSKVGSPERYVRPRRPPSARPDSCTSIGARRSSVSSASASCRRHIVEQGFERLRRRHHHVVVVIGAEDRRRLKR